MKMTSISKTNKGMRINGNNSTTQPGKTRKRLAQPGVVFFFINFLIYETWKAGSEH